MLFILEPDGRQVESPLALNPDFIRPVDHNLGDLRVSEEWLQRAESSGFVCDDRQQLLLVLAADDHLFLDEPLLDQREQCVSQLRAWQGGKTLEIGFTQQSLLVNA